MAVRRLYEPLCIAFGTTVSSPTVPTYQLYDLPHKFTPRLYMESEDPNLVLREIGVWAGWEQAGSADTRSFLLDLLKDKGAHGSIESFDDFAQNHDCKSGSIVVVRAILFDTKAAACAWKQCEKSKRRRQEQLKCMCPSSEMQPGQKKAKRPPATMKKGSR